VLASVSCKATVALGETMSANAVPIVDVSKSMPERAARTSPGEAAVGTVRDSVMRVAMTVPGAPVVASASASWTIRLVEGAPPKAAAACSSGIGNGGM